jgi:hypothetical protein
LGHLLPRARHRAFFPWFDVSADATRIQTKASDSRAVKMRQRARMTARARSRRVYASPDRENENRFHEKKHRQNWPKMALKTQDPSSSHSPNLSQRNGTRSISVRFLDTASRRRGFARGFSRELFSRGFATGGFTSSLFGTSHCSVPHSLFYDDYISFSKWKNKKTRGKEEAHKERACSSYIRS